MNQEPTVAPVPPSTCVLYHGDCLDVMGHIEAKSIDACIADLPYAATANHWDVLVPLKPLWLLIDKINKKQSWAIFLCDLRLAAELYNSNKKSYRHDIVWQKTGRPSGHLHAKHAPLRTHELILTFAKCRGPYNPQMVPGKPHNRHLYSSPHAHGANFFPYKQKVNENKGTRYPASILPVPRLTGKQLHPTQKPEQLMEWLIKSYTNIGGTVLDFTMGSATTGVACARLGRNFIGIEKDDECFRVGRERVDAERAALGLQPCRVISTPSRPSAKNAFAAIL